MKRLQESAAGKIAAALLTLALTFSGAMAVFQLLVTLPYMEADSFQHTNRFFQLMEDWQSEVASGCADVLLLETDDGLTYTDRQVIQDRLEELERKLSAEATWFRFQLKTADGQQVLYSNLDGAETLEETSEDIHYATFAPGEHLPRTASDAYASAVPDTKVTSSALEGEKTEKGGFYAADGPALILQMASTLVIECGVPPLETVLDGSVEDEFSQLARDYMEGRASFSNRVTVLAVSWGLALLCVLYLLWGAGHKAGAEGVFLTWQEKIFIELYGAVTMSAGAAAFALLLYFGDYILELIYYTAYPPSELAAFFIPLCALLAAAAAGLGTLFLRTLLVRMKAGALARTSLVCRLCCWLWRGGRELIKAMPFLWKMLAAFALYFFADLLLFTMAPYNVGAALLWGLLNLAALLALCWWATGFRRLRKGGQAIAGGNLNHQIDTHRLPYDLRRHAEDLNNISAGLSNAVDEKMKSERFKAELITNVSHDLKTPLTSIINYVNLLKTTGQSDPKAREYIEVLDRKSQRLKKLTEDLVEASKASTGVLRVSRDRISMGQLLDQALGEWGEKLEERKLTTVTALPEGETWVYADGRHLWRVMDNLLSNCAKYALEGTRIYLDLSRGHGQAALSIKNISREPLNIPPERLMERFVRGEESRTTEGSGLGLSIARSLTELQGGIFHLAVDGDLFKVTVTLPQSN